MKNVLKKLAQAKKDIKAMEIKKEGRNTYSKYDYFTPGQIEAMVAKVCEDNGLITMFSLGHDDQNNLQGVLDITDIETTESYDITMATAMPDIKATNAAQQLGGCMTYTERYLKMSAFGITDSNLDFDNNNGLEKKTKVEKITASQITYIENLLNGANLQEEEMDAIDRGMNGFSYERAEECIEYLKTKQLNPVTHKANATKTEIKNELKNA